MKKIYKIIVVLISIVLLGYLTIYYAYFGYLPPETPIKVARVLSDLKLSNELKLIKFKEQYDMFTGNGETIIIFNLTDTQFSEIENLCKENNYSIYTQKDKLKSEINVSYFYNNPLPNSQKGYYKVKKLSDTNFSFIIIVLDETNKILFIKQVIT